MEIIDISAIRSIILSNNVVRQMVTITISLVLSAILAQLGVFIILFFISIPQPTSDIWILKIAFLGGFPGFFIGLSSGVIITNRFLRRIGNAWAAVIGEIIGFLISAVLFYVVYCVATRPNFDQLSQNIFIGSFVALLFSSALFAPLLCSSFFYDLSLKRVED